jgi:superfamily II DNA or RNA helicase
MHQIQIEKLNETFLRVFSSPEIEAELNDYLTYEYPGAKYTPQYRARVWDGKVRLYNVVKKTVYVGLYSYLKKFAAERHYGIELLTPIENNSSFELNQEDINQLQVSSKGKQLEIRDYQIDAVQTALHNQLVLLVSPTGSGKSLIIYILARILLNQCKRLLVVVPTTTLVEQMYNDFDDYSALTEWKAAHYCQKLYSGFPKVFEKQILFTTWQSIYKQPLVWFKQFSAIIGDEAHQFKARSLQTLMEKIDHIGFRIGTTGSLDNKKIHILTLEGLFGPVYRTTTTRKLQDIGQLANLQINQIILKHIIPPQLSTIQEEIEYLVTHPKRNNFIANLALQCQGTTLVLFQFVEKQGIPLHQLITHKATNQDVYLIHGQVETEYKNQIREQLAYHDLALNMNQISIRIHYNEDVILDNQLVMKGYKLQAGLKLSKQWIEYKCIYIKSIVWIISILPVVYILS